MDKNRYNEKYDRVDGASRARPSHSHGVRPKEYYNSNVTRDTRIVRSNAISNDVNTQKQCNELTALKSTYDEHVLTIDERSLKGHFLAHVTLPKTPYYVTNSFEYVYKDYRYVKSAENVNNKFQIEHLPPIELFFNLDNYHSRSPPAFLITCKWLSNRDLKKICHKLESLWKESKINVLFLWFSFLQNHVLEFLGYYNDLDVSFVIRNQKPESKRIKSESKEMIFMERYDGSVMHFRPFVFRGDGKYDNRAVVEFIGPELIDHLKSYDEHRRNEMKNVEKQNVRQNDEKQSDEKQSDERQNDEKQNDAKQNVDKQSDEKKNVKHDADNGIKVVNQINIQKQCDELTALKSIFDDQILTIDESLLKGHFLAHVILPKTPYYVSHPFEYAYRYKRYFKSAENANNKFQIEHLPPIELFFNLDNYYPSRSPPAFLVTCKWLSKHNLEKICHKLESLWNESKMEVLFLWFSFLQNDVLEFLGYYNDLDVSFVIRNQKSESKRIKSESKDMIFKKGYDRIVKHFIPSVHRGDGTYDRRAVVEFIGPELISHLKLYDEHKRKEIFKNTWFMCNICLAENIGEDCIVFSCTHKNCRKCITDYFSTLIKDGDVHSLKCPELECDSQASPNLVRELVSEELYLKYDQILLSSVIDTMGDMVYCPRKVCGAPVIKELDSALALCSICNYAFCVNCKFTYHGIDPCKLFSNPKEREKILSKYRNGNAEEKEDIEKMFGKKHLLMALDDAACEEWIHEMTKQCPQCKASIEKIDGCNKMSCWKCRAYFCWICGELIASADPYLHFSDPKSKCFNQLFRGVQFNGFDDIFDHFDDE